MLPSLDYRKKLKSYFIVYKHFNFASKEKKSRLRVESQKTAFNPYHIVHGQTLTDNNLQRSLKHHFVDNYISNNFCFNNFQLSVPGNELFDINQLGFIIIRCTQIAIPVSNF